MDEQNKYEIIKSLVDHNGNKKRAAQKLNCTIRTVNRLIQRYNDKGKEGFIHGNRNRKPSHALSQTVKADICNLYLNKYAGSTFAHFSELLKKHDNINVSTSTIAHILYQQQILSPRTKKATKKAMRNALEDKMAISKSKKEKNTLKSEILALNDPHPRRPRCAYFGEMIQMDASEHLWFANTKTHLHIAIDDSTGKLVGMRFETQETLKGYYHVFYQILTDYGIPAMFYTDNRTVFEYRKKGDSKLENDHFTQFAFACHQLGVHIKTTSIPQAKGRVERAFQTLQQRLPIELRLKGISTIEEANAFLNHYIKEYNAKFALPVNHSKSVFETQPSHEKILQILSVITQRKVDAGHCIKFQNQYYKTINEQGLQEYFHKGTKATVIHTFDGRLLSCINDKIYDLDILEQHESISRNFDFNKVSETPKKRSIPDAGHPWRNNNFLKYKNHKLNKDMLTA